MRTGFFAPGTFLTGREPLNLDFSGTDRKGLEVSARPVPLGLLRDEASVTVALGRSLVSWNVRDGDGKPVPASADGLRDREPGFTAAVSAAYLEAVGAIGRPVPIPAAASPQVTAPRRPGRAKPQRGKGEAGDAQ